jgi:hypothetical protein
MQPKEVACWAPGSFSPIRKIKIHIVSRLFECYSLFIFRVNNSSTSDPSALAAFNKVRTRAGLPALNTLTKDIILKERMIEFNFEGDYWFDVQRQGFEKAKQILWSQERGTYDYNGKLQHVDVKLQFTNPSQLYLPIPASEITVNDLLAQPAVPYYK